MFKTGMNHSLGLDSRFMRLPLLVDSRILDLDLDIGLEMSLDRLILFNRLNRRLIEYRLVFTRSRVARDSMELDDR